MTLDKNNDIHAFHVAAQRSALQIEVRTGMRHSKGSVLKAVNAQHETHFTKKAEAIAYLDGWLQEAGWPS